MIFPCVILAGGRASRMGGGDKPLLPLGGAALLDHVIMRLTPQCAPLALSANGDAARFARFGLPVLPDESGERPGPLAGVLAGLDWAAAMGAPAVVSAAGDTPFLPRDLAARLAAAAGDGLFALAESPDEAGEARIHPTFGLWPVRLRGPLRAALAEGARRVGRWAEDQGAARAHFESLGGDPFFNINTPDDLRAAEQML